MFRGVGGGIVHQATLAKTASQTFSGSATDAGIQAVIQRSYGMGAVSETPGLDSAIEATQAVRNTAIVAGAGVAIVATGGAAVTAYGAAGWTGVGIVTVQTGGTFAAGYASQKLANKGLVAVGVPEDFAQPLSEVVSLGVSIKVGGALGKLLPVEAPVPTIEDEGVRFPSTKQMDLSGIQPTTGINAPEPTPNASALVIFPENVEMDFSGMQEVPGAPRTPYSRSLYGPKTPTRADRAAVGAGAGEVADHQPPLIERYYYGDPSRKEMPGYRMTPAQRQASAADRSRMSPQPRAASNSQGGIMSAVSRWIRRNWGL